MRLQVGGDFGVVADLEAGRVGAALSEAAKVVCPDSLGEREAAVLEHAAEEVESEEGEEGGEEKDDEDGLHEELDCFLERQEHDLAIGEGRRTLRFLLSMPRKKGIRMMRKVDTSNERISGWKMYR